MPSVCCVDDCKYKSCLTRKEKSVSFHRFPKNEQLRSKWIKLCKRIPPKNVARNCMICSTHFAPDAYERSLFHELLSLTQTQKQKRLKPGAIPTLHLPTSQDPAEGARSTPVRTQQSEAYCKEAATQTEHGKVRRIYRNELGPDLTYERKNLAKVSVDSCSGGLESRRRVDSETTNEKDDRRKTLATSPSNNPHKATETPHPELPLRDLEFVVVDEQANTDSVQEQHPLKEQNPLSVLSDPLSLQSSDSEECQHEDQEVQYYGDFDDYIKEELVIEEEDIPDFGHSRGDEGTHE